VTMVDDQQQRSPLSGPTTEKVERGKNGKERGVGDGTSAPGVSGRDERARERAGGRNKFLYF